MFPLVEADHGGPEDMDEGYKPFSVSTVCLGSSPTLSRMHFCKPMRSPNQSLTSLWMRSLPRAKVLSLPSLWCGGYHFPLARTAGEPVL